MIKKQIDQYAECPVTLEEAKDFIGVARFDTHKDVLIQILLKKNMKIVEEYANISLVGYNVTLSADYSPYKLPFGPIDEIVSVKDVEGVEMAYKLNEGNLLEFALPKGGVVVNYKTEALDSEDSRLLQLKNAIMLLTLMDYDGNSDITARRMAINDIISNLNGI